MHHIVILKIGLSRSNLIVCLPVNPVTPEGSTTSGNQALPPLSANVNVACYKCYKNEGGAVKLQRCGKCRRVSYCGSGKWRRFIPVITSHQPPVQDVKRFAYTNPMFLFFSCTKRYGFFRKIGPFIKKYAGPSLP